MELYKNITLHVTEEKFYLEPKENPGGMIGIDRVTQGIQFGLPRTQVPPTATQQNLVGVLGTIKLIAGNYLVVVTKKEKVGCIDGHCIWMVKRTQLIPYTKSERHLNEKQVAGNKVYKDMIQQVLNTPYLYFSYTYDITHSLQRLKATTPEFFQLPHYARAQPGFLWNSHLLEEFSRYPQLSPFCLPLIHGFVCIKNVTVKGHPLTYSVISRRSVLRVGSRLFTRGADVEGNVANFVETEQIVEFANAKSSFVQTRGSIPLIWQQLPNLRLKPRPKLLVTNSHAEAFQQHLDSQVAHYGKQVLVNLINQSGSEAPLEEAFKEHAAALNSPNIQYEAFDFHSECRNMKYDRLSILIDRLSEDQDIFGYFLTNTERPMTETQDGVFRTNCIDCLDRTNVVQSLLARRSLVMVLKRLYILDEHEGVGDYPALEDIFKNMWADNADAISTQYSGTGALKTDFTRSGKRTYGGMARDAVNSLTRYYKNNFADGFRQDALDLFVGNYVVQDGEGATTHCPLEEVKGWKYTVLPLVLLFSVSMVCATITMPAKYSATTLLSLLFWSSMVAGTVTGILRSPTEFVDYPKLSERRHITFVA